MLSNKHIYVVIMAGGEGVRFAPISTPSIPKQFHNIVGSQTLIRQTFERILDIAPVNNVLVSTNERYVSLVRENIPEVPLANILAEPMKKNTAPCVAYAAAFIMAHDPEGVMVVVPSDHVILDKVEFRQVMDLGVGLALAKKALITFGILPASPSPDYGYIKRLKLVEGTNRPVYWVERFVEKPTVDLAQTYIDCGLYYWNSGMFVWQASVVMDAIKKYLPRLYDSAMKLKFPTGAAATANTIRDFFEAQEAISIDYGVMERADNVITIPCSLGWSDIGTWQGLKSLVDRGQVVVEPAVYEIMESECRKGHL